MPSEDDSSGWHLTESDPGVFTYVRSPFVLQASIIYVFRELLQTLGVPFIVDDLYSLDPDSLASLQVCAPAAVLYYV
jgi:ubiquitin carboxyl-terminal hydrolase L5